MCANCHLCKNLLRLTWENAEDIFLVAGFYCIWWVNCRSASCVDKRTTDGKKVKDIPQIKHTAEDRRRKIANASAYY